MTDINAFPVGVPCGSMEAPYHWILRHTARFTGIVTISFQDGEGFLLARRGKPFASFVHTNKVSCAGIRACDYCASQQLLHFSLYRYTLDEFREALEVCRILGIPPLDNLPGTKNHPDPGEDQRPPITPPDPEHLMPGPEETMALDNLLREPGFMAYAVFSNGSDPLCAGSGDLTRFVALAKRMAESFCTLSGTLSTSPQMQTFVETPGGYVVIMAQGPTSTCFLTDNTVPLGQIRSVMKEFYNGH
jgi:hypothetical protein